MLRQSDDRAYLRIILSIVARGNQIPPPLKVALHPYDPNWVENALVEKQSACIYPKENPVVRPSCRINCNTRHSCKTVLDLMPVVTNLPELDCRQADLEGMGYEWWVNLV